MILTSPPFEDLDLDVVKNNWDIDWCTFDEFGGYVKRLWYLNEKNFKSNMNFNRFFSMELILLRETPWYFKYILKHIEEL